MTDQSQIFNYFESGGKLSLGHDPRSVDRLEQVLRALWSNARSSSTQAEGVYRLALANCVIIGDVSQRDELDTFASAYASAYPSRVITSLSDPDADELTATMSASCRKNPSGEGVICWEKIDLRFPPERERSMASAIRALLVGRIATVIALARPIVDERVMSEFIRWADLFVTSNDQLGAVSPMMFWDSTGSRSAHFKWTDLAWVSQEPFRRQLADAYQQPDVQRQFSDCQAIAIESPSVVSSRLLGGWLVSRLNWRLPRSVDSRDSIVLRDGTREFQLTFSQNATDAVIVTNRDGSVLRIARSEDSRATAPMLDWSDARWPVRVIDALHDECPDPIFLSAVDVAHRLNPDFTDAQVGPRVSVSQSAEEVAYVAAARFAEIVATSVDARGRCRVALAGGQTPEALYRRLGDTPFRTEIPWHRIDWFWSDERWVPHTHPDSNFRMAQMTLLAKLEPPAECIHAMPAPVDQTPAEAAEEYELTIREVFGANDGTVPRFDLIILGLGTDGHTASLFPSVRIDVSDHRLVWGGFVAEQDTPRLSFTPKIISAARHVMFLVTGEAKRGIVAATLEPGWRDRHPAARIELCDGVIEWFLDRGAAGSIDSSNFRS